MEKTIAAVRNTREPESKTSIVKNGDKEDTIIHNVNDLTASSVTGQFHSTMEIPSKDITVLVVDDDTNIRNLLY